MPITNSKDAFELAQKAANRFKVRFEVWEHTGDYGHREGDIKGNHDYRIIKQPEFSELPRGWTFIGLCDPDPVDDVIMVALQEAADKFHELAADHWSHQCSEGSPCIYCEAIKLRKEEKKNG